MWNSQHRIRLDQPAALAPFSFFEHDIAEFLALDTTDVTAIEAGSGDSGEVVTLSYEAKVDQDTTIEGQFAFLPERHWVLQGWKTRIIPFPAKRAAAFTYGDEPGVPRIARAEYWVEEEDGTRTPRTRHEVESLDTVSPPKSEFTLAAFGIEVPDAVASRSHLYFLAAGTVLVFAGYFVVKRQSK